MAEKIYFQIADNIQGAVTPQDANKRISELTEDQANNIFQMAKDLANNAQQSLLDSPVDKMTLEFGVQAGGEAGVPFVTKGTVGAHFKVAFELNTNKSQHNG